jgi:hypothetical protein
MQLRMEAIVPDSWDPTLLMRWLMIALLVSLVALLIASAGVAHRVWREHGRRGTSPAQARKTDPDPNQDPNRYPNRDPNADAEEAP